MNNKLLTPRPQETKHKDFDSALRSDCKHLNSAIEIFVMYFTNVNTINDETTKQLVEHLREAGRADLADLIVCDSLAAGLGG